MPWTKIDYPNSMNNLPVKVRNKAIEIANALLAEKTMKEGIVIATAISRAKDWAANHGIAFKNKKSKTTDLKQHGEDRYVIPLGDKWATKIEGEKKVEKTFENKVEAVKQASEEARKIKGSVTIQGKTGKIERKISYTPHNQNNKVKKTKVSH